MLETNVEEIATSGQLFFSGSRLLDNVLNEQLSLNSDDCSEGTKRFVRHCEPSISRWQHSGHKSKRNEFNGDAARLAGRENDWTRVSIDFIMVHG